MIDPDKSLTWHLANIGIRHEQHDGLRRKLYRGDEVVGVFSASEGWDLVRAAEQDRVVASSLSNLAAVDAALDDMKVPL